MRKKQTAPKRPGKTKPAPFGYIYQDGRYTIDEATSSLVTWIFEQFLDGYTLTKIAWQMDDEQWPTVNGGTWHPQTIRNILSNRFYVDSGDPIVTPETFDKAAKRLAKLQPGPQ